MVKTALVLGPNGGHALGSGGGGYVTLLIANALASLGYKVYLGAIRGLKREDLQLVHNVQLSSDVTLFYVEDFLGRKVSFPPYVSSRVLGGFLRERFAQKRIDFVVFGDDAPKEALAYFKSRGAFVTDYAHLPLSVRASYPRIGFWAYEGRYGLPAALLYWKTQFANPADYDLLLANSSVTARLAKATGAGKILVLHPPARSGVRGWPRKRALALNAAQYGRGFDERLAEGVLRARQWRRLQMNWVFLRASQMPRHLKELSKENEHLRLVDHLPEDEYRNLLASCVAITNLRFLEPFGISTVEAMGAGCVPIVLKSDFNGSWSDICDRGRFGIGVRTPEELLTAFEQLEAGSSSTRELAENARARSQAFTVSRFEEEFRSIVRQSS